MRLSLASLNPFGRLKRHARAKYEASIPSPWRSYAPTATQSAAKDIRDDRQGLLNLARRWDQNSPLIHGILERLTTYTIHTGIIPVPGSSSTRWNKQVAAKWEEWARRPEITDRFSWGTIQRILWRSALRDGDSFLLLTEREDGTPAVQMIEGHRVREPYAPTDLSLDPGDGVIRDANGKHVGYKLCRDDGTLERRLAGDAVVQFLLPERPDQPRGASVFASALKTIHNLDDILRLEQLAVKDASTKVDIIKTATGEMSAHQVAQIDEDVIPPMGQDSAGYYANIFGPETKVLKHGDEYTPYKSDRPSEGWQFIVGYLSDTIGQSTGLPPSVLLPGKLGGADTRKDLASAARTMEVWQWCIADSIQRVYEYVVGSLIDSRELGNAPKDWRRVNWQMPRSITADAGRDSKSDLELLKAGWMTSADYWGGLGYSAQQKEEEIAEDQKRVDALDPTGRLYNRRYSVPGMAAPEPKEDEEDGDQEEEPAPKPGEETPEEVPA